MKRKIKYQNRDIEGTEVSFNVMQQDWNEYSLNDGTIIKVQTVMTSVLRLEGEYNNLGDPIYIVHTQNIVIANNVPEHMRKQQC